MISSMFPGIPTDPAKACPHGRGTTREKSGAHATPPAQAGCTGAGRRARVVAEACSKYLCAVAGPNACPKRAHTSREGVKLKSKSVSRLTRKPNQFRTLPFLIVKPGCPACSHTCSHKPPPPPSRSRRARDQGWTVAAFVRAVSPGGLLSTRARARSRPGLDAPALPQHDAEHLAQPDQDSSLRSPFNMPHPMLLLN